MQHGLGWLQSGMAERIEHLVLYQRALQLEPDISHLERARPANSGRTVALKMIQAGRLASEDEVRRFHLETESAARLDHPNIVPIYEVAQHEGRLYFSMRFVEGPNLAQFLKRAVTPLTGLQIARLAATLARAVCYAHERGILHRDLKPANILIDAKGEPHITDIGLAKQLEGAADLTLSGCNRPARVRVGDAPAAMRRRSVPNSHSHPGRH